MDAHANVFPEDGGPDRIKTCERLSFSSLVLVVGDTTAVAVQSVYALCVQIHSPLPWEHLA